MATPQQIYYQNHRDAVREYKKAHYAKKSHRQEISLFKTIQLKGKTKGESRKIIKNAIQAEGFHIRCVGVHDRHTMFVLGTWIEDKYPPIRTDQGIIMVDWAVYETHITIILEPWMLIEPITI